ncbi:MAG: diacylglycerol kinase family lipid kinase [Phycisphaerae bacterium]|jgi:YegS/Rv2252/BmrU family lipid kinase
MSGNGSILMIVNPTAGRGRGERLASAVVQQLESRGINVTVRSTERRGDAEQIASEAIRVGPSALHCIVACGGDGTIQEVANAIRKTPRATSLTDHQTSVCDEPVMGLAPAGRCNDFARALGISKKPEAIVDTLLSGSSGRVDLGRVNERYFCTVATVGIDAEVTSFVDSMRMPLTGTAAYLYGALRVLARYQPRTLRITGDFETIEQPVFIASSANTSSYGGAIPIAPEAVPTDGKLDLCVIRHVSRLRALRLIPTVLAGHHASVPEAQFVRTDRLKIDADRPVQLWADGEPIATTPAAIETAPGAIRVMLP